MTLTKKQEGLQKTSEDLRNYPWNIASEENAKKYDRFFIDLRNFFGVKSVSVDMLGMKEPNGRHICFPALDENEKNSRYISFKYDEWRNRDEARIAIIGFTGEKVFKHKEDIDFIRDRFSEIKFQGAILDAKEFLENGSIENFEEVESAESKIVFPDPSGLF